MRILWFLVFMASFYGSPLHAQFTYGNPEEEGLSPERLAKLDNYLQQLVTDGIIPNAQVLIARRGRIVHQESFGYADLESRRAAQSDDIYRIASQTKALVTVGLMMLYEEGAFLLEDPLEQYLPAFGTMKVIKDYDAETKEYTTEPAKSSITIRQLLSHTSGIAYDLPVEGREELTVPFFASLEDINLEVVVERMARRPLVHHPGEGFTYGLGIDVAGRLLEVLSGQELDDFLRERIFTPLGMEDSYFYLPGDKAHRLVTLYSKLSPEAKLTVHDNATYRTFPVAGARRYFSGGAGSVGTILDYARFCQMLLNRGHFNGQRLLAPKTVDFMVRNHIGALEVWNRKDKFGLGFMIITPGSHYGDQATPGSYKWGGMYCSEFTIDPQEELIMLFYTNVHPIPQYSEIVRKFRIMTYAALMEGE